MRRATAVALVVQAAIFVPWALRRYVDGDEGFYLLAAESTVDGSLPYVDFFFPQMPLLPFVYGGWITAVGDSWYGGRLLSALLAVALGTLLYRHLEGRFGRSAAVLGLVLYGSSGLVLAWFVTVKGYALSTLLLFSAFVLVEGGSRRRLIGAGILLGLAIDTRLIVAAAAPVFAWIAVRSAARARARPLLELAAGLCLGLLPSLVFLALAPRTFAYDNLGSHGARSDAGLIGDLDQKVKVVANLLGTGTPEGGEPQFLFLFALVLISAVVLGRLHGRVPSALLVAATLGLASLLPTPAFTQYFSTVVPFLAVGAVELFAEARSRIHDPRARRAARDGLAAALAIYVLLGAGDLYRTATRYSDQRIPNVMDVTAFIQDQANEGEAVLASWPGYLVGTDLDPVPGLENDFASDAAHSLTRDEAARYKVLSSGEIEAAIEGRRTRLAVFRQWHFPAVPIDWEGALRRGGYELVARFEAGDTEIGGPTLIFRVPSDA